MDDTSVLTEGTALNAHDVRSNLVVCGENVVKSGEIGTSRQERGACQQGLGESDTDYMRRRGAGGGGEGLIIGGWQNASRAPRDVLPASETIPVPAAVSRTPPRLAWPQRCARRGAVRRQLGLARTRRRRPRRPPPPTLHLF